MFGMGLGEIFMIVVVAILFLGPDKLPETMVQIAKFFRTIKQTVHEAKSSLEEELDVHELKKEALAYKQQLQGATRELEETTMANLTSLESLNESDEPPKSDTLSPYDPSPKESIEPKREVITFPKKRRTEHKQISDEASQAPAGQTKESHA